MNKRSYVVVLNDGIGEDDLIVSFVKARNETDACERALAYVQDHCAEIGCESGQPLDMERLRVKEVVRDVL